MGSRSAPHATPRDDVLVITSTFPRHAHDVCGRFLQELFTALDHDVHVVCPDDECVDPGPWSGLDLTRFAQDGLFYGAGMQANRRDGRVGPLATTRDLLRMLTAGLRAARRFRVVWSHWAVPGGVVGALCRRVLGVPHVLSLHSGDVWWLEQHAGGAHLARWLARHSDALCAVSDDLAVRFEALAGVRPRVLGCGVPLLSERPVVAPVARRVGTLSRLAPGKGVRSLLDRTSRLGAPLHVAGDGPLAAAIRARCAGREAHWHGPLVGPEKTRYLKSLDVFLAPYGGTPWGQAEGCPVALLEALAAGLPVVAFASAAPAALLRDDETAVVVPDGDHDAFARAVRELVDDPIRRARLGAAARRAAEPYALPDVAAAWDALLASLMDRERVAHGGAAPQAASSRASSTTAPAGPPEPVGAGSSTALRA